MGCMAVFIYTYTEWGRKGFSWREVQVVPVLRVFRVIWLCLGYLIGIDGYIFFSDYDYGGLLGND